MSVFVAAPSTAITGGPDLTTWAGLDVSWIGWDGTEWRFTSPASGVRLARGGVRGLTMPKVQRYASSGPAVAGSRWRGARTEEREVFWPLWVLGNGGEEWVQYDRAFWRTMHPEKPGTWVVKQPNGETRSLSCRFVDDGDAAVELYQVTAGWMRYGVTLVAEQPYWQGSPINVAPWENAVASQDYYGGDPTPVAVTLQVTGDTVTRTAHGFLAGQIVAFSNITGTTGLTAGVKYFVAGTVTANTFQVSTSAGGAVVDLAGVDGTADVALAAGPPYYIGSGQSIANATMSNPGDVAAWPVWTVNGPFTSAEVGVDGRKVVVPFAMLAGESLTIDTAPSAQTAIDHTGAERTASLGAADFAPIEPGESVALSLSLVGAGSISASLQPLHFRAW